MCPSDDIEAKAAVRAAAKYVGPVYMRFSRFASPVFHSEDYKFEIGKGEVLQDGTDVAIIATGLMVNEARIAAEQLAKGCAPRPGILIPEEAFKPEVIFAELEKREIYMHEEWKDL